MTTLIAESSTSFDSVSATLITHILPWAIASKILTLPLTFTILTALALSQAVLSFGSSSWDNVTWIIPPVFLVVWLSHHEPGFSIFQSNFLRSYRFFILLIYMHLLLFPLWSYTYYTPAINLYLSNPPISLHLLLASYKYAVIPLPQYFYTYYFLLYICTYSTPPLSLLLLLSPYISKPTNCPYISASTHLPLYIYMYCIPPISLNLLIHYRSIPTIHPCISATTPLSPIYLQLSLSLPICLYLLLSPIYPYTSNIYLILSPPTSLPLYPNTHRHTHKF